MLKLVFFETINDLCFEHLIRNRETQGWYFGGLADGKTKISTVNSKFIYPQIVSPNHIKHSDQLQGMHTDLDTNINREKSHTHQTVPLVKGR